MEDVGNCADDAVGKPLPTIAESLFLELDLEEFERDGHDVDEHDAHALQVGLAHAVVIQVSIAHTGCH